MKKKKLEKWERAPKNSPTTVSSWKEKGAPNLSGQRQVAGGAEPRPQGRPVVGEYLEQWMSVSPFAARRPGPGAGGGEGGSRRRLVEHEEGTWRQLECRMYHLGKVYHLSEVEISRRLDLAVEDFGVVRSIAGAARVPRMKGGGA